MNAVRTALACSILGGAAALLASTGCGASPDENRATVLLEPDFETYKQHVDGYLNRRCGTLDCHGQPGRAYRVYGQRGLRLYDYFAEEGGGSLVSGVEATTEAEQRANYQAILGLEPEEMNRVVATQGEDPNKLLFLRKPLLIERHKGGQAMAKDDPGYRCVLAWLRIPVFEIVDGPDGPEPRPIPPAERVQFTDAQKALCADATAVP